MPDVGDRVSAEFVGTWTSTGTLKLDGGPEISTTGASLKVLGYASVLYAGQVWRRNADGVLFTINLEGTTRMASPANKNLSETPIPEQVFDRARFTLVYDPRD